jgi:hypothetical protein
VLLAMFVIPAVAGGTGTTTGLAVLSIFLVCFAAAWEARLCRMGIRIETERVVAIYAIGQKCFSIDTVAGFSLRRLGSSGGTRCVFIELVTASDASSRQ